MSSLSAPHRLSLSTTASASLSVSDPIALGGGYQSSFGQDINAAGVVTGYGFDDTYHAVRWAVDGTPTLLDNPTGYVFSLGFGINEEGAVAGESCGIILCRAVRWTADGTPTVLPSLDVSLALSINKSGQVVGYEHDGDFRAMHWSASGVPTRLARPEGLGEGPEEYSAALDINDAGVVVGNACGVRCKAVRWAAGGTPTVLDDNSCDLCGSFASSINNSGQITGSIDIEGVTHAAIWSESGELTVLPNPESHEFAVGFGINDAGQVAGYAYDYGADVFHAVIWSDGAPVLLPDDGSGRSIAQGIGLNRAAGGINSNATVWAFSSITYNFSGFLHPVDDPTVATNKARAGSAIPVRFSLGGDRGLDIFEPGYPRFEYGDCGSSTEDAIEQTVSVTSSGLTYNPANDTYTYNWKTSTSLVNQCGKLQLGLKDGTTHYAHFHFVR